MHRPDSLAELLRDESIEVERAALSIARDGRRFVDEKASLDALDQLAAPLRGLGERSAVVEGKRGARYNAYIFRSGFVSVI